MAETFTLGQQKRKKAELNSSSCWVERWGEKFNQFSISPPAAFFFLLLFCNTFLPHTHSTRAVEFHVYLLSAQQHSHFLCWPTSDKLFLHPYRKGTNNSVVLNSSSSRKWKLQVFRNGAQSEKAMQVGVCENLTSRAYVATSEEECKKREEKQQQQCEDSSLVQFPLGVLHVVARLGIWIYCKSLHNF